MLRTSDGSLPDRSVARPVNGHCEPLLLFLRQQLAAQFSLLEIQQVSYPLVRYYTQSILTS